MLKGRMPGVVQRFLCSLSQFNMNLQNTLTKPILILLSEVFQVTLFTQKTLLRKKNTTQQFNLSPKRSISFMSSWRNECSATKLALPGWGEIFSRNLSFYTDPIEQGKELRSVNLRDPLDGDPNFSAWNACWQGLKCSCGAPCLTSNMTAIMIIITVNAWTRNPSMPLQSNKTMNGPSRKGFLLPWLRAHPKIWVQPNPTL